MSFKSLVNKSDKAIAILVEGKQIVLASGATNVFPEKIAELFTQKYSDEQVEILELDQVKPKEKLDEEKDVWFANVSGNPDAPDSYEEEVQKEGSASKVYRNEVNPFKVARSWKEEMKGSMYFDDQADADKFSWRSSEGSASVYTTIDIPPYKIAKFKPALAMWIRRRTMNSSIMKANLTHLIESREPPSFKPDLSWDLDDIRMFLVLAHPELDKKEEREKLGFTEEQIRKTTSADDDVEQRIFEAKNNLLIRVFFRIADPSVPLPSREEFEAFKQFKRSKKTQSATA